MKVADGRAIIVGPDVVERRSTARCVTPSPTSGNSSGVVVMKVSLDRRRFLHSSAALGGSLLSCSIPLDRSANAAPVRIDAPIVDQVTVREITDNAHDIFLRDAEAPGLRIRRPGMIGAQEGKTLESEWGLALYLESLRGKTTRRYLLDFGYTPDVYVNNLELLKIDVSQIDALIISHGHFDHVGG
ncbi:MAG: MBL fold metallo-hydrolase, partial [Roseiarcus sp.]